MSDQLTEKYSIEDAVENSNNLEFMINAVKDDATWVLAYASTDLKENKDLIKEAVKRDGQILYYASEDIRDNKEIVLIAVEQKWLILKYVSYRLRSDKDVILTALKKSEKAKQFITKEGMEIPEIIEFLNPKEEKSE